MEKERSAIVLGSYKPQKWEQMKNVSIIMSKNGINVISPRDTNLVSIPLPDNPDFYYLQRDLDEAGLTLDDFRDLTISQRITKLDCQKLQIRVCKSIIQSGQDDLVYTVLHKNEIGKSASYELSLAILFGKKVAMNQEIKKISVEVKPDIKNFIESIKSKIPIGECNDFDNLVDLFSKIDTRSIPDKTRRYLIKSSLQVLLRNNYTPYNRPDNEFTEL